MKFMDDFKKFIFRGNVIDMAVGVVIGGAFGSIVTGLVNYIINPFIGIFTKGGKGLDGLKTVITEATEETEEVAILWGPWIQTIINFVIVALCIFLILKLITSARNKLDAKKIAAEEKAKKEAEEKAAAEQAEAEAAAAEAAAKQAALEASIMKQEALLSDIRDILKAKN